RQLPRAICPEVRVHDRVAIAEATVDAVDHRRRDELVVLAAPVRRLDRGLRRWRALPYPVAHRVVAASRPFPALVAIHRVVPTAASDAPSLLCGQCARRSRQTGILALAIASFAGSGPMPNPSRTTRTRGRGRLPVTPSRPGEPLP